MERLALLIVLRENNVEFANLYCYRSIEGMTLMNEPPDLLEQTLRESGTRYVVGTRGQPVAILLSIDEYEHYLDLLDDEADSQDKELALRLAKAAAREIFGEKQSFRDYFGERSPECQAGL